MERRLAAILAADMVGFSRLMATDETETIKRQQSQKGAFFDPKIAEYGGQLIKTTGDGLLVEFDSASDAVKAAIAIQSAVEQAERDVPADQQMRYRIGINLGEIVQSGGELLGDGINVAVRLESISEAGGICVSDTVRQATAANLDIRFHDLGERSLKNIGRKVHAWLWRAGDRMDGRRPAMEAPSELPSIAIIPFRNSSSEADDELLRDGIAEDVATALSKIDRLFVVARSSTSHHKDKNVVLTEIGREQGVRFILGGSVRRAGSRVRIPLNSPTLGAASRCSRSVMIGHVLTSSTSRTTSRAKSPLPCRSS